MSMFGTANQSQSDFKKGLNQVYTWYTGGSRLCDRTGYS